MRLIVEENRQNLSNSQLIKLENTYDFINKKCNGVLNCGIVFVCELLKNDSAKVSLLKQISQEEFEVEEFKTVSFSNCANFTTNATSAQIDICFKLEK